MSYILTKKRKIAIYIIYTMNATERTAISPGCLGVRAVRSKILIRLGEAAQ